MRKAAAQGHLKAADNYGLLLFQDGRREQGMPYIQAAADRGDPRAQYLLGIAHFNGDLVAKDWVRAYALLTLANSARIAAGEPGDQTDGRFHPAGAAPTGAKRRTPDQDAGGRQSHDAAGGGGSGKPTTRRTQGAPARPRLAVVASNGIVDGARPVRSVPRAIETTPVVPSVVAARAAVEEAMRVTGTDSPANAGADFVSRARTGRSRSGTTPHERRARRLPARSTGPAATTENTGPWRVQLGAFSVRSNADNLWNKLSGNAALAGTTKLLVPAGRVTQLQAGGFASRGAAQTACAAIKRGGQACLVTK